MRKIRLFIASSLDGYIARTSGEVDWLFSDSDYGYAEFFAQIDTVIMGNKTYQQILGFGEYPYKGKKGFVFSQILQGEKDNNVEFVGGDLKSFINKLRQSSGGDIWLVGVSQKLDKMGQPSSEGIVGCCGSLIQGCPILSGFSPRGAQIIHYFLKHDLLDELILSIHPIILGDGIPLLLQCAIAQTNTTLR